MDFYFNIIYSSVACHHLAFQFFGNVLTIQTPSGESFTYQDDEYAKSGYFSTPGQDGATIVRSILPASQSGYFQVGAPDRLFDDIYCGTLHANQISVETSSNVATVISQGAGEAEWSDCWYRLWSDGIMEYSIDVQAFESIGEEEYKFYLVNTQFGYASLPSITTGIRAYSSTTAMPVFGIILNKTENGSYSSFTVKTQSGTARVFASFFGKLTDSSFQSLKNAIAEG